MTPSSILDIIVIIYYIPAFVLALIVLLKQGSRGKAGWISLVILGVLRLVGSATGIVAEYKPSTGVVATSLVLSNIGTISLLAALMGIIKRANTSMKTHALPERLLRFTQLPATVAAILAIVGGVDTFNSDPSKQADGRTYTRIAVILLLVVYLTAIALCIFTAIYKHDVPTSERRLLLVSILSLPFVLVRLILAFCAAFRSNDPNFSVVSTTDTAVIIRALMGILMEFIVVAIFTWAGFTVKANAENRTQQWPKGNFEFTDVESEQAQRRYPAPEYRAAS